MKLLLLILTLFSIQLSAQIDITTIDDWSIISTSEHDLVVSKSGKTDRNQFVAFRMERPFCVCKNPVINLVTKEELEKGSTVKAIIKVDMKKSMEVLLVVLQKFGSSQTLFKPRGFPSLRSSSVVEIKSQVGNETFLTKGIDSAMKSSESMCKTGYYFEEVEESKTKFEIKV